MVKRVTVCSLSHLKCGTQSNNSVGSFRANSLDIFNNSEISSAFFVLWVIRISPKLGQSNSTIFILRRVGIIEIVLAARGVVSTIISIP